MKFKLTMKRIAYMEKEIEVDIDDDLVSELSEETLHDELEKLGEEAGSDLDWSGSTNHAEYELESYQEK